MTARVLLRHLFAAMALALVGVTAVAQEASAPAGECVESTDWMRRNHMMVLGHTRNETVHEGTRDTKFALQGCISCHAKKDEAGEFITVENPQHFCRSCHETAAVQPDCFQCHASRPEAGAGPETSASLGLGHAMPPPDGITAAAEVETYLKEAQP